jgi:hypothetical protein
LYNYPKQDGYINFETSDEFVELITTSRGGKSIIIGGLFCPHDLV